MDDPEEDVYLYNQNEGNIDGVELPDTKGMEGITPDKTQLEDQEESLNVEHGKSGSKRRRKDSDSMNSIGSSQRKEDYPNPNPKNIQDKNPNKKKKGNSNNNRNAKSDFRHSFPNGITYVGIVPNDMGTKYVPLKN